MVEIIQSDFLGPFWKIMNMGGVLMWPLLACSVLSLTVILERLYFWTKFSRDLRCADGKIRKKIDEIAKSEDDKKIEFALRSEVERMEEGLSFLETIISISPLLGILGTILGIIDSFNLMDIKKVDNISTISKGISQALITTAAGLFISIFTIVFFNYFVWKVGRASLILNGWIVNPNCNSEMEND